MADVEIGPDTRSSESSSMLPSWSLISDILAGAARIRSQEDKYLPKYEDEDPRQYARRLKTAPWRPEFDDALRSLGSKPFGKDVGLKGDVAGEIKALAEDVDGRGNNLTTFARQAFGKGIAKGLHAILVDYPTLEQGATRAAVREAGARPYWVHIEADDILALYTRWLGGIEVVVHVRIRETTTQPDGFGESKVERVRVLEPGRWEIWEKRVGQSGARFVKVDEGEIARGGAKHGSVPLVLFYTGEREGELAVKPPLLDLAWLQIELYQALSRQDEILTFAGSPMLVAENMAQPTTPGPDGSQVPVRITVGPKSILFAPPSETGSGQSSWKYIQPDAKTIEELRLHVASIVTDMRRLGMQPLTAQSGRPTATGQSIEAAKAHSAVQAWAMGLKDALEQAWTFTAEWIGEATNVECEVSTDFAVVPYADAPLGALDKARARRDVSIQTYWDTLKRFDVLAPDFDPEKELVKVEDEWKRFPAAVERDPATGRKIDVDTSPAPAGTTPPRPADAA